MKRAFHLNAEMDSIFHTHRGALEVKEKNFYNYYMSDGEDFVLDDVICDGSEANIFDCRHADVGIHDCGGGQIAGVVCDPTRVWYVINLPPQSPLFLLFFPLATPRSYFPSIHLSVLYPPLPTIFSTLSACHSTPPSPSQPLQHAGGGPVCIPWSGIDGGYGLMIVLI